MWAHINKKEIPESDWLLQNEYIHFSQQGICKFLYSGLTNSDWLIPATETLLSVCLLWTSGLEVLQEALGCYTGSARKPSAKVSLQQDHDT